MARPNRRLIINFTISTEFCTHFWREVKRQFCVRQAASCGKIQFTQTFGFAIIRLSSPNTTNIYTRPTNAQNDDIKNGHTNNH